MYVLAAFVAVVAIVTISAAYASQSAHDHVSFNSDLPTVLKFLDSAILTVRELPKSDIGNVALQSLDSYSLASSNPTLFQYISKADESYNSSPQPSAPVQVMIERIQADFILKDINFNDRQYDNNKKLDNYTTVIEMDGKYF